MEAGEMQRMFALAGVSVLLVAGALAQSDSDYQGWMKTNGATVASLNKEIAAKDGPAAAAEVKNLQSNCGGCHMAHRERTPEGAFKIK
jgi:hypothetical protein